MRANIFRKVLVLQFVLSLTLVCAGQLQAAKNDLLMRASTPVKNLTGFVYMDVARAGDRLVAVGEMGMVALSDDDGKTWVQSLVPTSVTLTAVYFPTAELGWAVGHDGIVLHTADAGKSWKKQLDGNLANELGVIAAKEQLSEARKKLAAASDEERADLEYYLEDVEFMLKDIEFAAEQGASKPFMDVWFANEREGLIVGAFGMIFRTGDGGESWTAMNHTLENPDGFHLHGLAETKDALLLVGEAGTMYRSFDKGLSWEVLFSPYEGPMFGIGADIAGNEAVAVGLRGKIVVMGDNGGALELLETPVAVALNAAIKRADGAWVLVGLAGQVLVQKEQGAPFALAKVRFPKCMSVVETKDGQLVLAGLSGLKRVENASL